MLRINFIITVLGLAAVASAQNTTMGIVGITRVSKPAAKLNLIGNNFDTMALNEFAPAEQYNGDISAGNSDAVYIWSGSTYAVYAVYDERPYLGPSGAVEWRDFNNFTGGAVNPEIPAGSSLWLYSLGSSVDANTYISGNVVSTQFATNQVTAGLQQLCYPFSTDIDLNDTLLSEYAAGDISAGNADIVYAWNVDLQTYKTYALYDERPYLGPSGTVEWRDFNTFSLPAGSIPVNLGEGFWYNAVNGFTWVETNKYYNNL